MKKIILFAFLGLTTLTSLKSQNCTPTWPNGAGPGISPNVTTGLPAGNVNQAYNTTLQFKVPKDTTYNSIPVTISDITITGVTGLSSIPSSTAFAYNCNPSGCVFPGDSVCCVSISGIPTTAGTYPITVYVTIHIGSFIALPDSVTGYHIDVLPAAGISNFNSPHSFEVFQNVPNPFKSVTQISMNIPKAGSVELSVYDLLGNLHFKNNYPVKSGINSIEFNGTELSPGVYFYNIVYGDIKIIKRLIVDKK